VPADPADASADKLLVRVHGCRDEQPLVELVDPQRHDRLINILCQEGELVAITLGREARPEPHQPDQGLIGCELAQARLQLLEGCRELRAPHGVERLRVGGAEPLEGAVQLRTRRCQLVGADR
jgi:hypothetical protein